jgi:hypothetical protein
MCAQAGSSGRRRIFHLHECRCIKKYTLATMSEAALGPSRTHGHMHICSVSRPIVESPLKATQASNALGLFFESIASIVSLQVSTVHLHTHKASPVVEGVASINHTIDHLPHGQLQERATSTIISFFAIIRRRAV